MIIQSDVLTLIPWNKCNARCNHCGPTSGPNDKREIKQERCLFLIEEFGKISNPGWVLSLTGGEIFIYKERALELVKTAFIYDGVSTIVSNGFWANSYEIAKTVLTPFVENGLKSLGLSISDFHTEFIPLSRVCNAANAADNLGISVEIKIAVSHTNTIWKKLKEFDDQGLVFPAFTKFVSFPILPNGRAKFLPTNKFSFTDSLPNEKCPGISPTFGFTGKCFACCNGGGDLPSLQRGDIYGEDIKSLLLRYSSDSIYQFLQKHGPAKCIEILPKELRSKFKEKQYVDVCHLCIEIFSDETVVKILEENIKNENVKLGNKVIKNFIK